MGKGCPGGLRKQLTKKEERMLCFSPLWTTVHDLFPLYEKKTGVKTQLISFIADYRWKWKYPTTRQRRGNCPQAGEYSALLLLLWICGMNTKNMLVMPEYRNGPKFHFHRACYVFGQVLNTMSLAVKWGEWHPFHESNMNMNSTRKKPIIMALLGDERWTSWERSGRQVPEVKRRLSSQIFCVLCWEVPFLKTLTSLRKMVWKSLSGWLGGVMSHPVCSSQTNPQMPSLIVRTIQKRHMPQSEEIFMSLETEE